MRFESVLQEVGAFGAFQVLIVVLMCSPRIVLPCHFLLNNFIAAVPAHRCDLGALEGAGLLDNLTQRQRLTVAVPAGRDGVPESCRMFARPQFQLLDNSSAIAAAAAEDLPVTPCRSGWVYDNSTFASTLATEWDLVCDRKSLAKTTNTIFFLGVMLGAVVFGFFSDKYGRRKPLLASYLMSILFGCASAFADSYVVFAVLRFLTGVGLTGISIISIVLSIEWVDTDRRSLIGVAGSLSWSVGNMLLAAFAYLTTDWRALLMAVTAPLGLAVLTWWLVPESARWLLAHGDVDAAQRYLDRCARLNGRQKLSTKVGKDALYSAEDKQDANYSYLGLVRTPKLRRLTVVTGIVWYGVASTYYGISLNIAGFGLNMYLTHFVYAAIEVPAKLLVFCCLNVLGRRKCQAGTLLLTGLCIVTNIFVPPDLWYLRASVAVLGKGLSEASFTTVFLYTTELFPTVLRQNSLGYTSFMSRLGASLAPLVLLLEDVWAPLPQVIIGAVTVVSGLLALTLPETLGVRLPETVEDVENPRKATKTSDVLLEPNSVTGV